MPLTPLPDLSRLDSFEFIVSLTQAQNKRAAQITTARRLSDAEIGELIAQGNTADNWNLIRVSTKFTTAALHNNRFFGQCILGSFNGKKIDTGTGIPQPTGIYDSIIADSVIGDDCCICNVKGCCNYFIDSGAVLFNIGTIVCAAGTRFGNGRDLVIGTETGGREIRTFADLTIGVARTIAFDRSIVAEYHRFVEAYCNKVATGYGVVEADCRITNCPSIADAYFGAGARCSNVTIVRNSTILSSDDEPVLLDDGAYVRNSIIQWGGHVGSMAIVDESVLTEHAHAERHGKITHSIIGPNTGIAEGEVTASLVGPFVGFHHQSLLIGALWPEGKGNVAYGANVGSNHTAKAPDQEIYCGEGVFFGLGVNIKFPADFSRAPYSIIATGVTTLPQRVEFPFSLINTPVRNAPDVPPAYNELLPGWVLSDNLYAVARNEGKFRKRDKARRSAIPFEVFKPEIIDLMVAARDRLRAAPEKEWYTEADIPGIGKNFVSRQALVNGITVYSWQIERYCLAGLFREIKRLHVEGRVSNVTSLESMPSTDARWEHERLLLNSEGYAHRPLAGYLRRFADLSKETARSIASAKEKDDTRGRMIMSDYETVHTVAAEDAFVKETAEKTRALLDEITDIIAAIGR